MITPEEENNKPQNDNNDENNKGLYDKVQYEPFEKPYFISGCLTSGAANIIMVIITGLFLMDNGKSIINNMFNYISLVIILIINFSFICYYFKTGRKSFAYGIITATLFFLLISGSCFLN